MSSYEAGTFIVIIAPCPIGNSAREGWMSRIQAVDRVFEDIPRIYLDPYSGAAAGPLEVKMHSDIVQEYRVELTRSDHHALLEKLILACRFVYVHTAHLGRFLLPFYPTGKIITDMHGIVPEEERMLGRPDVAKYYEGVERIIMKNSQVVVVVTEAMRDHLCAKHPDSNVSFVCLPIIEDFRGTQQPRVSRQEGADYRIIYAGGTQVWQNIDRSLEVCEAASAFSKFEFLSIEHDTIRTRASGMALLSKAVFSVVDKCDLPAKYLQSDFGLVLRDDTAVNRVSCPTKLSEYLWFGVIPVVKTAHVGDFLSEGFSYVTDQELEAALLPDEATCERMRVANRGVIDRLIKRYEESAALLRSLSLPNRIGENSLSGLPIGQRHLIFPSHAELYMFAGVTHHLVRDVIDIYGIMHWQPDVRDPVRAIRLIPIMADSIVTLASVELSLRGRMPVGVKIFCATPGRPTLPGVRLERRAPYFDLHFTPPLDVGDVTVKWEKISVETSPYDSGHPVQQDFNVQVILRDTSVQSESVCVVPIAFTTV